MKHSDSLNYRIVGDGYPVLFIHGFLESNAMWSGIVPYLRKKIQPILVELPGHGESTGLHGKPSISNMALAVREVINELGVTKFSIVGHSLGGYVALEMIKQLENFSEKLLLLNSHPWGDSDQKKDERNRVIKVVEKNKELFIRTAIPNLYMKPENNTDDTHSLIEDALKMNGTDIIYSLKAMRDRPNREQVMRILVERCKVIQGKHDHMINAGKMTELTSNFGNEFALIENAGHMSHHEDPKKVIDEINTFI
tara:strand:- start:6608 stop:7366 length:759 start_codon:yes stop_codon:yes gene_type:complete